MPMRGEAPPVPEQPMGALQGHLGPFARRRQKAGTRRRKHLTVPGEDTEGFSEEAVFRNGSQGRAGNRGTDPNT